MKGHGMPQDLRDLFFLLSIPIHFEPICQLCLFGNFSVFAPSGERYLVHSNLPLNVGDSE